VQYYYKLRSNKGRSHILLYYLIAYCFCTRDDTYNDNYAKCAKGILFLLVYLNVLKCPFIALWTLPLQRYLYLRGFVKNVYSWRAPSSYYVTSTTPIYTWYYIIFSRSEKLIYWRPSSSSQLIYTRTVCRTDRVRVVFTALVCRNVGSLNQRLKLVASGRIMMLYRCTSYDDRVITRGQDECVPARSLIMPPIYYIYNTCSFKKLYFAPLA
jgi:hypothetical protein